MLFVLILCVCILPIQSADNVQEVLGVVMAKVDNLETEVKNLRVMYSEFYKKL